MTLNEQPFRLWLVQSSFLIVVCRRFGDINIPVFVSKPNLALHTQLVPVPFIDRFVKLFHVVCHIPLIKSRRLHNIRNMFSLRLVRILAPQFVGFRGSCAGLAVDLVARVFETVD